MKKIFYKTWVFNQPCVGIIWALKVLSKNGKLS